MVNIVKYTEKEQSVVQRVCVYGGPKTGKSQLVAQLSEHYNLLWFDLEKGYLVMNKLPQAWKERINLIEIPDSRVFPIAIETCMKVIRGTPCTICQQHGKVDCAACKKEGKPMEHVHLNALGPDTIVVFDSLTQLTNSGISHITKAQADDYKLQLDDWGALRVLIDKFLSQVQVAPFNVVCITHEEEVTREDGTKKIVPVSGSSNSSRNTAKYFDHVVYCDVKNKRHVAGSGTDFSMGILAGSRTDVRLEAGDKDKPASLLDIFTSWKLPLYGAKEVGVAKEVTQIELAPSEKQVLQVRVSESQVVNRLVEKLTAEQAALTPGQIALQNLKAKMATTK